MQHKYLAGVVLIAIAYLLFAVSVVWADEIYGPYPYMNDVRQILKHPRKIDPKHNPADRPLHDPWDDIWRRGRRK